MADDNKKLGGHLIKLSVQYMIYHDGRMPFDSDYDDEEWVDIFIWLPHVISNKDRPRLTAAGCATYYDYMGDVSEWRYWWDHFEPFCDKGDTTGTAEVAQEWENVPFDDPRIDLAYTDPLAQPAVYENRRA